MSGPQATWLADGKRLHLHHGPIDLIVEAFGEAEECAAACRQAADRFNGILEELVAELPELRRPASQLPRSFAGVTSRRMERAVSPFAAAFITPMAAVAGAVADEVLAAMTFGRNLDRAYVNNGGDIAIHLARGQRMRAAIASAGHDFADRIVICHADGILGIATSGWRGRSHSLGVADAVTVLARDAAAADAAATMIANAVDLPVHAAVRREPANRLAPDSDLGERLVTVGVGILSPHDIDAALEEGLLVAQDFVRRELIAGAALFLQGATRVCGHHMIRNRHAAPPHRTLTRSAEEAHA